MYEPYRTETLIVWHQTFRLGLVSILTKDVKIFKRYIFLLLLLFLLSFFFPSPPSILSFFALLLYCLWYTECFGINKWQKGNFSYKRRTGLSVELRFCKMNFDLNSFSNNNHSSCSIWFSLHVIEIISSYRFWHYLFSHVSTRTVPSENEVTGTPLRKMKYTGNRRRFQEYSRQLENPNRWRPLRGLLSTTSSDYRHWKVYTI